MVQQDVPDNIPMPSMVSGDKYLVIERNRWRHDYWVGHEWKNVG